MFSQKEITKLGKKNHLQFIFKEYVQSFHLEGIGLELRTGYHNSSSLQDCSIWQDWTYSLKINCRWFLLPSGVISF